MDVRAHATRHQRRAAALTVLGIGLLVSAFGGATGIYTELPAFAFLALCAFFFTSRAGAFVLLAVMAVLALLGNRDMAASPGPTGREIGFALMFVLLLGLAVIGVVIDLVVGLVWRSAHWRSPLTAQLIRASRSV